MIKGSMFSTTPHFGKWILEITIDFFETRNKNSRQADDVNEWLKLPLFFGNPEKQIQTQQD